MPSERHAHSLAWETPAMPTPSFWYFETERGARLQAGLFGPLVKWSIRKVEMTPAVERVLIRKENE